MEVYEFKAITVYSELQVSQSSSGRFCLKEYNIYETFKAQDLILHDAYSFDISSWEDVFTFGLLRQHL